jgi:hypothetical protein
VTVRRKVKAIAALRFAARRACLALPVERAVPNTGSGGDARVGKPDYQREIIVVWLGKFWTSPERGGFPTTHKEEELWTQS